MKKPPRLSHSIALRNILFATDFSAASLPALPYAINIARRFGSKLFIAHIVPPADYPSGPKSLEEAATIACREAEPKMSALLKAAACRDLSVQALIGNGDIWVGLSEVIHQHAIDLLAMGTTGRSGIKKFFLGSVEEEAMRESSCPVLTVGPESHAAAELGFRQILYASDFSTVSVAAAPYAFAFSKSYGSRLTLVHALEGLPESPYLNAQMAKVRLRKLVPQGLDLTAKPEIIVEMEPPAKVILRTAENCRSDLIVIGARGAGAYARLSTHLGSVAHKIVSRAMCPVLTVRPMTNQG